MTGSDVCGIKEGVKTACATFIDSSSTGNLNCFDQCGLTNVRKILEGKSCFVGDCGPDGKGPCDGDKECRTDSQIGAGGGLCIGKPKSQGVCQCYEGYTGCPDCQLKDTDRALGAKCGSFKVGGQRCSSDTDCG
jgi:hypothetical protein